MSSPSTTAHESPRVGTDPTSTADAGTGGLSLLKPVEVVGFWAAVTLPFLYLPLLFTAGGPSELSAALALMALHAVALLAGRHHRQDT